VSRARLLLALGGALLGLLLAEFALSWFGPQPDAPGSGQAPDGGDDPPPGIYAPDELLLYRLVPDRRRTFQHRPENGGGTVEIVIDPQGFRGAGVDLDGPGPRVLVLGDSFVAAEYTPEPLTFVARLEAALRAGRSGAAAAAGDPLVVLNAGVNGYGPDQCLLRLEQELPRVRPELVVLVLFAGNDYGDLLRNRIFGLDADGRLVRQDYHLSAGVLRDWRQAEADGPQSDFNLLAAWRRLESAVVEPNPPSAEDFVDRALRSANKTYRAAVLQADTEVNDLGLDHYDADVAIEPDGRPAAHKRALMEQVLLAVRDACRAGGARLLLVVVPSPIDACDDYPLRVDPARWPGYERERLGGLLAEMAARATIPCLDLLPAFRAEGACHLYLRGGDQHWNEAGQELGARLAAEAIVQEGLL